MLALFGMVNLNTSFVLSPNSFFQLKAQPFFFVTFFRSAFVRKFTSVAKLSPDIAFRMEFC